VAQARGLPAASQAARAGGDARIDTDVLAVLSFQSTPPASSPFSLPSSRL